MINFKRKSFQKTSKIERANAIFRKMDTDFTNTLSEDEFVNGCLGDPILKKTLNIFD